MITYSVLSCGAMGANLYLLTDVATGKKALADCPAMGPRELLFLKKNGVESLAFILFTHGHFDHILGAYDALRHFGGQTVIHAADAACLSDETQSLCAGFHPGKQKPLTPDRLVADGEKLLLGETALTVLATPGHTKGSVCYLTDGLLFSGDTLFPGSCGRTDFPGGSMREMKDSLQRLARLEGDLRVLPGHDEPTSLAAERRTNPYMR